MGSESDDVSPAAAFHIRPARKDPSDAVFIAEAFDSSRDFLASIGSGSQWGPEIRRENQAFVAAMEQHVADSMNEEDTYFHIAEKGNVNCGGALVMSSLPDYVKESDEAMLALKGLTDFDYLCILVTDRRVDPLNRGVGSALIQYVKKEACRKGRKVILVDCWDGNDGILVRYYRKQGFHPIAGISKMGKHIVSVMWTGALLRMDL